ncbi:MAG: flagellar protein FlgN [Gemmatimonadaceae bacterium]
MNPHHEPIVAALAQALVEEERILADVIGVLLRQREAIARDDLAALDDSVFATHRMLLTLGEARRRRITLNNLLGEADDLSMGALDDTFGGAPPPAVQSAMDALGSTGEALRKEIDLNQRVLRVAVDAGDQLVRAFSGVPVQPAGYGTAAAHSGDGVLFDRRV